METAMTTLLKLNSSIFSNGGQSSRLADEFVIAWSAAHPGSRVIVRDFARDAVPHLKMTGQFGLLPTDWPQC